MLKKVVVTNYLGESITYKITEGDLLSHKNKIPVTLDYIKSANPNNSTRHWINNTTCKIKKSGQDVTFTVRLDSFGRVKAIDVAGYTNASITFKIATCSFATGSSYKLSGCTGGASSIYYLNIKDVTKAVSSAYKNYNNDTNMTNSSYPVSDSFEFSIIFKSTAQVSTTFYPMVRVSTESSEFEPYDDNERGEVEDRSGLLITSIEGLGPVKASVKMTEIPTTDGAVYNSARLSGRNIVIDGVFTYPNSGISVEDARLLLYKYFPIKEQLVFRVVTDNRVAITTGYVESVEPVIFSNETSFQVSVLCESAYFNGPDIEAVLTPQSTQIAYGGDIGSGVEVTVGVLPPAKPTSSRTVSGKIYLDNKYERLNIDLSKMSGLVPNTALTGVPLKTSSFLIDTVFDYKPFSRLPEELYEVCFCFIKDNAIHLLYTYKVNNAVVGVGIIKYDESTKEWQKLASVVDSSFTYKLGRDGTGKSSYICFLGSKCFLFYGNTGYLYIYELDIETLNITEVTRVSYPSNTTNYVKCIKHGDSVYIFASQIATTVSSSSVSCNIFNGVSIVAGPGMPEDVFPRSGSDKAFFDKDSFLLSRGNKLYIFRDVITDSNVGMWTYNGTNWSRVDFAPGNGGNPSAFIVFGGRVHCFIKNGRISHAIYTDHDSYGVSGWEEGVALPFSMEASFPEAITLIDSEFIKAFSPSTSGSYDEPANNDHLIENDKLVVDTNKGKKSILLYRDGKKYNVLNVMEKGSTWPVMRRGTNRFSCNITSGAEDADVTLRANEHYQGV